MRACARWRRAGGGWEESAKASVEALGKAWPGSEDAVAGGDALVDRVLGEMLEVQATIYSEAETNLSLSSRVRCLASAKATHEARVGGGARAARAWLVARRLDGDEELANLVTMLSLEEAPPPPYTEVSAEVAVPEPSESSWSGGSRLW